MKLFNLQYLENFPKIAFGFILSGGITYFLRKNLRDNYIIPKLTPMQSVSAEKNQKDQLNHFNIFSDVIELVKSSCVALTICNEVKEIGRGSGFIIDEAGYVLTNAHVAVTTDFIATLYDGKKYRGKTVAIDFGSDLALVKIISENVKFQSLKFAEISKMRMGQFVIAFGNPGSFLHSATVGVISGIKPNKKPGNYILTDALIKEGSSGSPLVNLNGEVVGIIFGATPGGLGAVIPCSICEKFTEKTLKICSLEESLNPENQVFFSKSKGRKKFVGIEMSTLQTRVGIKTGIQNYFENHGRGVKIESVFENSPAQKAGVMVDDIIISVNEKEVYSSFDIHDAVTEHDVLNFVIIRKSEILFIGNIVPEPY